MNLLYPGYHCITPVFLLIDNSDSPSIVEQLPQGCQFLIVIPLLVIVPSSLTYPMPYAWFLASCSMGSHMFLLLLLTLHSPLLLLFPLAGLPLGFCSAPFYLGYSPIEFWDSLSGYVYPGIACLAFQASDWLGAFWASLSDYPPLLGVYPSMTFC